MPTIEIKHSGTSALPSAFTLTLVTVSLMEPWFYWSCPGTCVGKPWAPWPSHQSHPLPHGILSRPDCLPVVLPGRAQACGSSPSLGAPAIPASPHPEKPLLWGVLLSRPIMGVPSSSSCLILSSAPSPKSHGWALGYLRPHSFKPFPEQRKHLPCRLRNRAWERGFPGCWAGLALDLTGALTTHWSCCP